MTLAVIMVRSSVDIKPDIGQTLKLLRLRHINHCVLVPGDECHTGMVKKVKDFVTWGEVDQQTLRELLESRGRVAGDGALDVAFLKKASSFKSLDELTSALIKEEVSLKDVQDVKPLFRLSPPRKGWKGIKRAYTVGGALGYRGEAINDLIRRMI